MREFPKGGLIGRVIVTAKEIADMHIPLYAAYASFFIILSMFPFLLLVLGVLRYIPPDVESFIRFIGDILPRGMMDEAENLIYGIYQSTTGTAVGISAAAALWSSSKGTYGILRGLNAIYDVSENRGYVYTRIISVGHTFLFLLVILLTLMLHVFGNSVISMLTMVDHPVVIFLVDFIDLRFFLLLILQSLIFTLMFMALPNGHNRFLDSLPGGLLASCGWLIFSDLYSVYMEKFPGMVSVYGGVYAIALSMVWLYCCMNILFYGGVLNRYLKNK